MRNFLITLVLITFFQNYLHAQQTQLQFKKLIYVSYDVDPSGNKINIKSYREIENGEVRVIQKLFRGVSDTSYLLPDTMTSSLNSIFNGKQKLRSYLKTDKKFTGHYAGSPYFISCTHLDNTVENIIIEDPYLEKEVYKRFDLLTRLHFAYRVAYQTDYVNGTSLDNIILKEHKDCTYLIKQELPPPGM